MFKGLNYIDCCYGNKIWTFVIAYHEYIQLFIDGSYFFHLIWRRNKTRMEQSFVVLLL